MSEETRKQIERDAIKHCSEHYGILESEFDIDDHLYHIYCDAAAAQDAVAENRGYNQAIDDVLKIIESTNLLTWTDPAGEFRSGREELKQRIEKLKHERA